MARAETIAVYNSQSREYHRAFQVFLDHTDQKLKAQKWLTDLIGRLPSRRVFIDAGAGNGKVTTWFTERFGRTIAIEPNASLRSELKRACPTAEVIAEKILDAKIGAAADLILCSHVFYYIDVAEWLPNLNRLASWLSSGGVLVLVVQNHDTDCMRMLEHFFGRRVTRWRITCEHDSNVQTARFDFLAIRTLSRSGDAVDGSCALFVPLEHFHVSRILKRKNIGIRFSNLANLGFLITPGRGN